jgi:hypothetical protein
LREFREHSDAPPENSETNSGPRQSSHRRSQLSQPTEMVSFVGVRSFVEKACIRERLYSWRRKFSFINKGVLGMVHFSGLARLATMALTLTTAFQAQAAGAGNTGGGCYNMQIIAQKSKTVSLTGTSGHALFVTLGGGTKILLQEGPFNIIDRNGTDGSASFSLPNPDPTNSGTTAYSVFMRLVGKPGSGLDLSTCGTDALGEVYCSEESISMSRIAGTSRFTNVSQQLLYVYADVDGDGDIDRLPLFDSRLADYFWQLDSLGRLHAQVRFCPVSTQVK